MQNLNIRPVFTFEMWVKSLIEKTIANQIQWRKDGESIESELCEGQTFPVVSLTDWRESSEHSHFRFFVHQSSATGYNARIYRDNPLYKEVEELFDFVRKYIDQTNPEMREGLAKLHNLITS